MNHLRNLGVVIAIMIIVTACGSTNNEPLTAGEIDLVQPASSAGGSDLRSVAEAAADAPGYCRTLAEMDTLDDQDDRFAGRGFELFVELLDGLAAEGPKDSRSEIGGYANDFRAFVELDVDLDDPAIYSAEEFVVVVQVGVASEGFDELAPVLVKAFLDDCGAGFMDSISGEVLPSEPVESAETAEPSETTGTLGPVDGHDADADLVGEPFEETIVGPFGSDQFNNTDFEITDVQWSNRPPSQYGETETPIRAVDADRRFVYLTVALNNTDPNDSVLITDEHLTLIAGDGDPISGIDVSGISVAKIYLEPVSSQIRTYGFEVGAVLPTTELTLRYADGALPGFIKVSGPSEPNPYPIPVTPPAPVEYFGNLQSDCDVPYSWTVDTARVLTEIPVEYESPAASVNSRARVGSRWLHLEGFITSGDGAGSCTVPTGVVSKDSLRLIIDGRPVEPMGAPIRSIGENASVGVNLLWEIPVDAKELAIKALGRDSETTESPLTLPELPTLRGE